MEQKAPEICGFVFTRLAGYNWKTCYQATSSICLHDLKERDARLVVLGVHAVDCMPRLEHENSSRTHPEKCFFFRCEEYPSCSHIKVNRTNIDYLPGHTIDLKDQLSFDCAQ